MSDINNTNVDKIKRDVDNMLNDIYNGNTEDILQEKYNYLFTTSRTLFKFIIRECNKNNFKKDQFDNNLKFMLNNILKIQKNELTQNDASENVGKLVAKQFIPQLK
jgi:hypothetical protein